MRTVRLLVDILCIGSGDLLACLGLRLAVMPTKLAGFDVRLGRVWGRWVDPEPLQHGARRLGTDDQRDEHVVFAM